MTKKRVFFTALMLLLAASLIFVIAEQITEFNGYASPENLTFTGNQNITRSIAIYRYANVTNAFINLSGFDYYNATLDLTSFSDGSKSKLLTFQSNTSQTASIVIPKYANVTSVYFNISGLNYSLQNMICNQHQPDNSSAADTANCSLNYSGGYWFTGDTMNDPGSTIDNNWGTYASARTGFGEQHSYLWVNYSKPPNATGARIQYAVNYFGTPSYNYTYTVPPSCYDYYSDKVMLIYELWALPTWTYGIASYCKNSGGYYQMSSNTYQDDIKYFYEEGIMWNVTNTTYPSNINIKINNSKIWNYSGTFSQLNNKTTDLYSIVAANLTACTATNGNCTVDIIVHSDTPGQINLSDLRVSYNNYPYDPWIEVGTPDGVREWSHSGAFRLTNNRTADFNASLNTALNNGACNCTGCSIVSSSCLIPFTFHSNSEGILEYSNLNILYNITANISLSGVSVADSLDVGSTLVYGRYAQNYSPDVEYHHYINITDDTKDHYVLVTYSDLNAVINVYVNDQSIGTIPANAGGTGTWKTANFSISNSYLNSEDNDIKIVTPAANGVSAYIDKFYFVQDYLTTNTYFKNATTVAIIGRTSSPPDKIKLNYTYSNGTNILDDSLDKNVAATTTSGNIISLLDTTQYEGYINFTIIANTTTQAALISSEISNITVDKTAPSFNTITASTSNLLVGRTYNISINQTEANPSTIEMLLNEVSQGNLIRDGTSNIWNTTITYDTSGNNNVTFSSIDLAGNSYNYTLSQSVSEANVTQALPILNTLMSKTNYLNITTSDVLFNLTFKVVLSIATQGTSYISDYNVNATITDTNPTNISVTLNNGTIINFTYNNTNPNWTTDAFNNTQNNSLTFSNNLIYTINETLKSKYADVGVGNERLYWAVTQNITTNITDIWVKFPIRTGFNTSAYSIQMKRCNSGHTYGGTTCADWVIVTTTLYYQGDNTYNGGYYPTVDSNGDGTKDTIYFKVPNINTSEIIMYSFDTVSGAETIWTTGVDTGGGGGGGDDENKNATTTQKGIVAEKANEVIGWLKAIGGYLDNYIFQPIGYIFSSITVQWNDTVGFIVISALVVISGIILFLSGRNKNKIQRGSFNI